MLAPRMFFVTAPILLLAGCSHARHSASFVGARPGEVARAEVQAVLYRQVEAWNKGDVEGFMTGYWNSPQLSFSAKGQITRGYDATLEHFRTAYPDRAAMGKLTFTDLEITPLCPHVALVLGRWRLEGVKPASGAFSLTMQRIDGQWRIIHDHTSRDAT